MKLVYSCHRETGVVSVWISGEGRGRNSLLFELPLSAGTFDERVGMACLFAAAPELLKACEQILDLYHNNYDAGDVEFETYQYVAVRLAVAKARGEESG